MVERLSRERNTGDLLKSRGPIIHL
jgi:hypothetical protein